MSPVLHEWAQTFIAASPFVVLASSDAHGNHDASPRGGPPGFCRVLDAHTIAIPEQPGNNLLQTIRNVKENPGIALLFLIPGISETARVNGIAEFALSKSPGWTELSGLWADGEQLRGSILVHVKEAYYHCGRAGKFARLWDIETIRENAATRPVPKRPARPPSS
ncbi:pyridoxamine 5'-phosphate oxidase family protein [Streptomyces sp. NPDC005566]|uniref:pyridoxamine 5'-phosphate oxidase family protein n=1 Tax=Streptomyces sp. NPDC005566 TaxID=3156886 RepID=UPI0033A1C65C